MITCPSQRLSIFSSDFERFIAKHRFSVCINAAGCGNVGYSIEHPINDFEANTYAVAKVLDSIRKHQPSCKYLHISSAAVYGNPRHLPVHEMAELAPLSPYGFNKLMSEQLCTAYYKLYDIPITIIRPFSVFGNGLKKQLLWDICCKISCFDEVELFGTGKESRDFIHVQDLALLIDLVIEKSLFNLDIINAASGTETTIQQIALMVETHFGNSKKIHFTGQYKMGDPLNWLADTKKATALGFINQTALEPAIAKYVDWFKANATEQ